MTSSDPRPIFSGIATRHHPRCRVRCTSHPLQGRRPKAARTAHRRLDQPTKKGGNARAARQSKTHVQLQSADASHGGARFARRYASQARSRRRRWPERPGFTGVTLSEILTNEMQPKILNQTRLLANLMTKGVSKSLTRSDAGEQIGEPTLRIDV